MKSASSFTLLPDFALYFSLARSCMIRVGGQSGTAIFRTMSAAPAGAGPPTTAAPANRPAPTRHRARSARRILLLPDVDAVASRPFRVRLLFNQKKKLTNHRPG